MPTQGNSQTKTAAVMNLEFVVSTSSSKPSLVDRKRIRSHVLRTRARRCGWRHKSWINPELSCLPEKAPMLDHSRKTAVVPRSVCPDIALVHFPEEMQPYMLRDLFKYVTTLKSGLSPFEACMEVHHEDDRLSAYMMEDPTIFHMALFQVRCYFDGMQGGGFLGPVARLHLNKLLRLLQRRLRSLQVATSDLTILIVCALIMAAHDVDDEAGALKHMAGLRKIIGLKGGVRSLTHNGHRMQRKVCRADLSVALQFGSAPLFFSDDTPWETYLANKNLILNHHDNLRDDNSLKVTNFLSDSVDSRLSNVWADLREFSRVANLACQTGGVLDPSMVNEAMVSTMYRLLHLSFLKTTINETIRLGLLAFAASIFLKGQISSRSHQRLASNLRTSLARLERASVAPPYMIKLWLALILAFISSPFPEDLWLVKMIDGLVQETKLTRWFDARAMLKSVMWIDSLHDWHSRVIIEMSISRLNASHE